MDAAIIITSTHTGYTMHSNITKNPKQTDTKFAVPMTLTACEKTMSRL